MTAAMSTHATSNGVCSGFPSGTKPLSHQVAGHANSASGECGFYECEDGSILKHLKGLPDPRGKRELEFYQNIFAEKYTDTVGLKLKAFLPRYISHHLITPPGNSKPESYVQLEDITKTFKNPCIADIKMGKITYDPEATQEKIRKESTKYPPLEKIGFQLRGMRVYKGLGENYDIYGKQVTRTYDENTILTEGLKVFFSSGGLLQTAVVQQTLDRLETILQWFKMQEQFSFYASSLLIVYEGATSGCLPKVPATKINNENTSVDVRMIDFAHVFPTNKQDENYTYGLNNLIIYLKKLLENCD